MSYDKRRILRLYSDGKSYVLTSQLVEEQKLHIKLVEGNVCANKITNEEWNSMKQSRSFTTISESFGCLGLLTTNDDRNSLPQHCLIFVKDAVTVGTIRKFDIIRITDVIVLQLFSDCYPYLVYQQQNNTNTNNNSNPHSDVRKFLASGNFYFAYSQEPNSYFDLTLSSQSRNSDRPTEKKFLWNKNLHIPFRRLGIDTNTWLLKVICGCVDIKKVFTLSKSFKACLFSRLSCERVGTRFNCRGVNDDGNCANFVETEQVLFSEDSEEESSFLQLRGSVPVFFQQTGINVGTHRITVSRGIEACYPAFERHMKSIVQDYGTHIYILNLLGTKGDESFLTECFSRLCKESHLAMNGQLSYTNFDYHQEMKVNRHALGEKMWANLVHEFYIDNHKASNTDQMFFYYNKETNSQPVKKLQTKFIRTNCMDCLDRTNNVQAYIGIEMLAYQLKNFLSENDTQKIRECRELFRQMWILNGDCISKIYAGTGAIQGRSVTQDISRSLTRAIQNNFLDNNKQDAMDTILFGSSKNYGDLSDRIRILMSQNALRLPNPVLRRMITQNLEYTKQIKCRVCIGTWNINGGLSAMEMEKLDLNEWLIDGPLNTRKTGLGYLDTYAENLDDIDIFCVGFEEICDLTAGNIVSASDQNSNLWYQKLCKFLQKHGQYAPLIIEPLQLVGVCIFVFVKQQHVGAIRDVSIAKTKTGLGGAAGNKGGVLVRLTFYNTSMCFVCSHFAAHQKEIQQRNEDFRQIYEKSEFIGSNKVDVAAHDYVFWCGDLNYRIDMENQLCRNLISECSWSRLLESDQLSIQHENGRVFEEFEEGPISFPPTYKYNIYEDTYDRSEKCRVPAWTDRVLWRRRRLTTADRENINFNTGKCLYYGRTDTINFRSSDHRPVAALLEVEVNKVISKKQIEVLNKVMNELVGPFQVILAVRTHTNIMNKMVKDEVEKLFSGFKSFSMIREYKSCLYVTYYNGKYAYDAYAQLNNYYIEKYDITLLIKVENEERLQKLFEQELWDCLETLYYNRHNSIVKENNDVDLLGSSFTDSTEVVGENEFSSFNVPSHIHSSLTIYQNLNVSKSTELDSLNSHNPLIKALSNSNLNDFDPKYERKDSIIGKAPAKQMHSAMNLLDISNDEISNLESLKTNASNIPPKRPPPPVPAYSFQQPAKEELISPLVDISTEPELGFADDFSKMSFKTNKSSEIAPSRPPPLPPLPDNIGKSKTPFFTLHSSDSSETSTPMSVQNDPFSNLTETQKPNQSSVYQNDPFSALAQQSKTVPPPLPPMPLRQQNSSNNFKSYIQPSNGGFKSYVEPSIIPPPLPPPPSAARISSLNQLENKIPPPLPQRPKTLAKPQLDLFGNPVFNPTSNQNFTKFDPFA